MTSKITGLTWDQGVIVDRIANDSTAFGKVGRTVAVVIDVDEAIDLVHADLLLALARKADSGQRITSPAHHSVLRKLIAIKEAS